MATGKKYELDYTPEEMHALHYHAHFDNRRKDRINRGYPHEAWPFGAPWTSEKIITPLCRRRGENDSGQN